MRGLLLPLLKLVIDYESNDPLIVKLQLEMTTSFTEVVPLDSDLLLKTLRRVTKLISPFHPRFSTLSVLQCLMKLISLQITQQYDKKR